METQYFENYYTAYLSEIVSLANERDEIIEMRFGTALYALYKIKKPYKNVLGIKVEEFAQTILQQNVPEQIEEILEAFVTLVGQFTNNKKLIQMGKETNEVLSKCGADDEQDYKANLNMVIPHLQLQPSRFTPELEMLEAA